MDQKKDEKVFSISIAVRPFLDKHRKYSLDEVTNVYSFQLKLDEMLSDNVEERHKVVMNAHKFVDELIARASYRLHDHIEEMAVE